jgi:hypothetical protein
VVIDGITSSATVIGIDPIGTFGQGIELGVLFPLRGLSADVNFVSFDDSTVCLLDGAVIPSFVSHRRSVEVTSSTLPKGPQSFQEFPLCGSGRHFLISRLVTQGDRHGRAGNY